MTALAWLVPVALGLGGLGLAAFLWSLRSGQFDDLEGAGWRALQDATPAPPPYTSDDEGAPIDSAHVSPVRGEVP
jgi:cbb3-type cytochrome oxidase maturation protein